MFVLVNIHRISYYFGIEPDTYAGKLYQLGGATDDTDRPKLTDPPMGDDEIKEELAKLNEKGAAELTEADAEKARLLAEKIHDKDMLLHLKAKQKSKIKNVSDDEVMAKLLQQSERHIMEIKESLDANKQLLSDISNKLQSKNEDSAKVINRLMKCPACPVMDSSAVSVTDISKHGFGTVAKTTWRPSK
jgi:hypothetical protein